MLSPYQRARYSSLVAFVVRCAGNACIMQNIQTWAVDRLPPELMTHGTAIANTLRQVGGAFINATLFALMGLWSPSLGELGAIRAALGVSLCVLAVLGGVVVVRLRSARSCAR